jgi:eukaryotic-like serine/threonine-protein kinase
VYAAGVLLYEMLTGQKPHQADSPIQVAYKHVHEDIPPPSRRAQGLPAYVDALVARATARDKDLRPADARVLLHQVRRVRQALDHGVLDDPELTADLRPRPSSPRTRDLDETTTGELFLPRDLREATAPRPPQPAASRPQPASASVFDPDFEVTTPVARVQAPPPSSAAAPRPASAPPRQPEQSKPTTRRSRRGPILLVCVLALALLVGLGGWYLGVARFTSTPAVINLSATTAKAKVEKAGLTFKATKEAYSETVAKGSVISTDPGAGDRISKNGTVAAVISLGPERHAVPDVRGKTLDEAQALLTGASLGFGQAVEKYSEKVPQGQVINTDPAPGTPLRRDSAVNVIVSKGKKPITIPDWTSRNGDKAVAALTDLGFQVNRDAQNSDTVPIGRVISQSPSSGTGFKGDAITVVVSKGPALVQIPSLKGQRVEDATKQLQDLGFHVEVARNPFYVGADYVVGSDPAEGSMAPQGSTVTLSIV